MKSLVIVLIAALCSVSFAKTDKKMSGERNYGMAGCGLGSMLMGKDGGQIFAATTNGTSGNQTFGISTGTLNCTSDAKTAMADKMDKFIVANRSAITSDIARGNGETITSLTEMMGCKANPEQVGQVLQKNYQTIFSSENTVINRITDSIIQSVSDDSALSTSCTLG